VDFPVSVLLRVIRIHIGATEGERTHDFVDGCEGGFGAWDTAILLRLFGNLVRIPVLDMRKRIEISPKE
jgi:hypothetical protein